MNLKVTDLLDSISGFQDLSRKEQIKIISFFYTVENQVNDFSAAQISKTFLEHSLHAPANISRDLNELTMSKTKILIKKTKGYSFERSAKKSLEELYLKKNSPPLKSNLRELISKLNSVEQQLFLEECIACFEVGAYRSAIVMCWLLAMDTIYEYIIRQKLVEFNEAVQSHGKYKKVIVVDKDQFTEFKESDFIELLRVARLITNDIRKILIEKLDLRNTCAHPNAILVRETKSISFIEDLVENVILKYIS